MTNLSTSNNSHQSHQLNLDSTDDWQQKMAKLVGLEDDLNIDESQDEIILTNPEDNPKQEDNEPVKSTTTISSNPFAKVAVVGAGTLITVVGAGIFLSQIMGGGNNKSSAPVPATNNTPEPEMTQSNPQTEIELLKTKLALSEQAKAVKSAQIQLKTLQPATPANNNPSASPVSRSRQPLPSGVSQPQTSPRVIIQRVPTPAQTVYVPRIVTVEKEKIVRVPQLIASSPQPRNLPRTNPSPIQSTPLPSPTPTNNLPVIPNDRLANVPTPTTPAVNPVSSPQDDEDIPNQTTTPSPRLTTVNNSTNKPSLVQNNRKIVPVGTSVPGILAIAIFGESQKSPSAKNNSDNTFVVRLQQPLKNRDNSIALPKGTELLAQINNISDTGMVQLQIKSAIVNQNGNAQEITLPQAAMRISAPQGKPLIAEQYPKRGRSIARMDAGLFLLGSIGKVAELSNRTNSQIITTTGGNIVSQNNPRTNILTGALEGGMNSIVPQITARNQQSISEMTRRGNIWFMPAGTKVEIFVNQQLQL